jgi:nitrous oxide reductase accessory protein NosL
MKFPYLMIAAAGSALIAGSAMAQDQASPIPTSADQSAMAPTDATAMPPAADPSAPATLPAPSSSLGNPATMVAGDTHVVSNGPVPDTPENRAKYGKPMSNAGKKSSPAGN